MILVSFFGVESMIMMQSRSTGDMDFGHLAIKVITWMQTTRFMLAFRNKDELFLILEFGRPQ